MSLDYHMTPIFSKGKRLDESSVFGLVPMLQILVRILAWGFSFSSQDSSNQLNADSRDL